MDEPPVDGPAATAPTRGGRALVLGTAQGLAVEAERVRRAAEAWRPDAVALGVGPEDVAWLQGDAGAWLPEGAPEPAPSERHYLEGLRAFGDVEVPPPCLLAAIAWARDAEAPVTGLDLREEDYLALFLREVSTLDLCRAAIVTRHAARRGVRAANAWQFAAAWGRRARSVRALDRVEAARERQMARALGQLPHRRALAVVEAHHLPGVLRALPRGAARGPPRAEPPQGSC